MPKPIQASESAYSLVLNMKMKLQKKIKGKVVSMTAALDNLLGVDD